MINHLYTLRATGTNPYENLATEACLMEAVPKDAVILYLWQNRRTVVIGKNQNAWAECKVEALERDGGFLARRPSGGGAVFHDLGNLNFSFVAVGDHYDVARQLEVLIRAVGYLGIKAERSGRNDVLAGDRKFSGNAFSNQGDHHCHHGTIMVDVDTTQLANYLNVSPLKLKSKGVSSVRSRVCNLADMAPDVTVSGVEEAMVHAFGDIYGSAPVPLPAGVLNEGRLAEMTALYSAWEWRFGRRIPFTVELRERLSWGEVVLQLDINEGRVRDALCFSDAIDTGLIEGAVVAMTDRRYTGESLCNALLNMPYSYDGQAAAMTEMARWLKTTI